MSDLNIKIYSDGANINDMLKQTKKIQLMVLQLIQH